jgi:hypothetical protein
MTMDPLVIPNARGRFAFLLLINVALLLASLALLAQPQVRASPSAPLGWLATILMAGSVPLLLAQVLETRPILVVDERGIWYRPFGLDFIPWTAIAGVSLESVIGATLIRLELDDPERWLAQSSPAHRAVAWLNQAMGFPAFSLNLSRIGVRPRPVFERIMQIRAFIQTGRLSDVQRYGSSAS